MRKLVIVTVCWLSASVGMAQYPYYPPGWGYWNKAEAVQQQQFENQMRAIEFQQRQWDRAFGSLDITERSTNSAKLRLLKEQERALRLDNDRKERINPFR